jgi:PAS domain S-box-containing protein
VGELPAELLVYSASLLLALGVSAFSWAGGRAGRALAGVALCQALWIAAYMLEATSAGLQRKLFWDGLQYVTGTGQAFASFVFVRILVGRAPLWRALAGWAAACLGLSVFLVTAPWHGAARGAARVLAGSPFEVLEYPFEPPDHLLAVLLYGLLLAALFQLSRRFLHQNERHTVGTALMLAGLGLPLVATLMAVALDVRVFGQRDLGFIFFGGGAALTAMGLYKAQLVDLVPVGRDAVFGLLPEPVLVVDGAGRLVDLNPAAAHFFGSPRDGAAWALGAEVAAAQPGLAAALAAGPGQRREVTLDGAAGTRTFEAEGAALGPAQAGLALVLRDVTDRRANEVELERRVEARTRELATANAALRNEMAEREQVELRFRAIFDQTFQFIGLLDVQGRLLAANRTALDFAQVDEASVLGALFWETPWWKDQAEAQEKLRDAVTRGARGEFVRFEAPHVGADGLEHWVDFSLKPVFDAAGRVHLLIPEGRDITELKTAQHENQALGDQLRQAQKLESIGRLAGGVAHDFNNLLTVIQGNVNLLLDEDQLTPPVREGLAEIQHAAESASGLTRQLLAFSRREQLAPRRLDLREVVSATRKLLDRLLGDRVQLVAELAPELPPVLADPGQLEQVLINLAVNARDAMPEGGVLTLRVAPVTLSEACVERWPWMQPGPAVRLEVEDTGIGMGPEVLVRVFEPFFTTKGQGHGTGLGLATVYGAVRQHGGAVDVSSEVGRGTRFTIHLPAVSPGTQDLLPLEDARPLPPPGVAVAVVDDRADVLRFLVTVLEGAALRVRAFQDPAAALLELTRAPPVLLVSDVSMPGMSGLALARALTQRHPQLKVLLVSGYSGEVEYERLRVAAPECLLGKPFTAGQLRAQVAHVLASARAWGEILASLDAEAPAPAVVHEQR